MLSKIISLALHVLCMTLLSAAVVAQEISFHQQVLPLLTRAGCNSGACHGAAAGRGGLHLSLFGSNPSDDYESLVHQLEGRRINRISSVKSLLLRKPLGQLNHGGDQIFDVDSFEYRILKKWLDEGATLDVPSDVRAFHIHAETLGSADVPTYQLRAWATRPSESSEVDVTAYVQFTVTDPDAVQLDIDHARVQLTRPGRHVIITRYLDRIEAITLSRAFPAPAVQTNAPGLVNSNLIDREVHATLNGLNLPAGRPISDADFLRRVSLDLTGRLPDPHEAIDFRDSDALDKRHRMVERLLATPAFDDYWTLIMSRWLHLHSLPNETQGAEAYGNWIRQCVSDGVSWRDMTRQLLTSNGDSHTQGPANFSRMVGDARTHAEMVSEVFLAARLGCANCHDHPLDRWTQDDYHGLAAMLARIDRGRFVKFTSRGEVVHPNTHAPARLRLPGDRFVEVDTAPLDTLAQWLTDSQQTRLSQAFTNRIWSEMFGRGLVEAVDDMRETNPPSHPELLSQLSTDVVARNFDLRCLLRSIASSETYAREVSEHADAFYGYHQGRQLTPHVLADAFADVTGMPLAFEHTPPGTRAVQILDPLSPAPALDALGRCQRATACTTPSSSIGLATQLHLINGDLINRQLLDPGGRLNLLVQHRTSAEIVEEFSLRAFGQTPDDAQLSSWSQHLEHPNSQERQERLQDWLWSVLSSQRFQQNR